MNLRRWMGLGVLFVSFPAAAQMVTAEGIVELDSADQCNQDASYRITNLCTGHWVYATNGLDDYVCENVVVEGWDVGVECVILNVQSATPAQPACRREVLSVRLHEQNFTWLDWWRVACADRYDVIRGNLDELVDAGGTVGLGTVVCFEDDTPYGSSFSNRDSERPEAGRGFFYLVRAYGPNIGQTTYGWSSSGSERVASAGDCSSSP